MMKYATLTDNNGNEVSPLIVSTSREVSSEEALANMVYVIGKTISECPDMNMTTNDIKKIISCNGNRKSLDSMVYVMVENGEVKVSRISDAFNVACTLNWMRANGYQVGSVFVTEYNWWLLGFTKFNDKFDNGNLNNTIIREFCELMAA